MLRDTKQRLVPARTAFRRWTLRLGGGVLLGAGICAAAAATAHAATTPASTESLSITADLSVRITPSQPGRVAADVHRLLHTITGDTHLTPLRDLSDRVASPAVDLVHSPAGLPSTLDRVDLGTLTPADLPAELPDLLPGLAVRTIPALLIDEPTQGPAGDLGFLQRVALSPVPSVPAAPTGPRPTGPVPALPAGTGAGAADHLQLTLAVVTPPSLTGLTPSPLWWLTTDPSGLHPRDRADSPPFTPD